jgi:hypothetical protein
LFLKKGVGTQVSNKMGLQNSKKNDGVKIQTTNIFSLLAIPVKQ